MANKINLEQICSVREYPKLENHKYKWQDEYRHWFWKNQPEGFYVDNYPENILMTKEQIEQVGKCYVEDKKVFFKPHVHVTLSNKNYYEKYFKTVEEMQAYSKYLEEQGLKLEDV